MLRNSGYEPRPFFLCQSILWGEVNTTHWSPRGNFHTMAMTINLTDTTKQYLICGDAPTYEFDQVTKHLIIKVWMQRGHLFFHSVPRVIVEPKSYTAMLIWLAWAIGETIKRLARFIFAFWFTFSRTRCFLWTENETPFWKRAGRYRLCSHFEFTAWDMCTSIQKMPTKLPLQPMQTWFATCGQPPVSVISAV